MIGKQLRCGHAKGTPFYGILIIIIVFITVFVVIIIIIRLLSVYDFLLLFRSAILMVVKGTIVLLFFRKGPSEGRFGPVLPSGRSRGRGP